MGAWLKVPHSIANTDVARNEPLLFTPLYSPPPPPVYGKVSLNFNWASVTVLEFSVCTCFKTQHLYTEWSGYPLVICCNCVIVIIVSVTKMGLIVPNFVLYIETPHTFALCTHTCTVVCTCKMHISTYAVVVSQISGNLHFCITEWRHM